MRHTDKDLNISEDFVGLYSTTSTTGADIAWVLKRMNLEIGRARAQTYDGASNMMGKHKGCGAILKKVNPLILQFHCQAHAANLVVQAAADSSDLIKNSIAVVHELSKLSKGSIKVRQQLQSEREQLARILTVGCLSSFCDHSAQLDGCAGSSR